MRTLNSELRKVSRERPKQRHDDNGINNDREVDLFPKSVGPTFQLFFHVLWNPRSMSFIVIRNITGRPCGHVVGDDVVSRRSISHCIFSCVSFMLIFTAALQARLAAISSRSVCFAWPRLSSST